MPTITYFCYVCQFIFILFDESYVIDKLKYNVIDQNERINISKLEAYTLQEVL